MTAQLPSTAAAFVRTVSEHDPAGFIALFTEDAVVDDAGRESRGREAIREWAAHDIFAANVTFEVRDVTVRSVHVLVAEAFHGPRPPGQVVRHVDGVNTDNRPGALDYGTRKDNAADARRHGTARYGENHPNTKLTAEDVTGVKFALQMGVPRKAIAAKLNVSVYAVHAIAQGRRWRDEPTAAVAAVNP